jgi:enoyl-[acyl-carrier protein] reductase III
VETTPQETLRFDDKSVLVTGGSRGIGRGIALRFAELGAARVAISYLRNDAAAEETAKALEQAGAEPLLLRGNLGDPGKAAALVEQAGPLDVLVSNAATGVIRPALEIEEKHWDWTLNANARALLTLTRHAAPSMLEGSSIVAISSLGSQRVLDDYVVVGVSKAALEALVRYLAVELAPKGIRVNAVSAGLVETGALEYFETREVMLDYYRSRTPAGRLVEPGDVADAVCFLASPAADMIRGQTIIVDGGYSVLA